MRRSILRCPASAPPFARSALSRSRRFSACRCSKNFSIGPSTPSTNSEIIAAATASAILGQSGGGAQCGSQPDRAGRREAFDFLLLVELQNRAGAEKADAGRDALDHASHGLALLAGRLRCPAITKIAQPIDTIMCVRSPAQWPFHSRSKPDRAAQQRRHADASSIVPK